MRWIPRADRSVRLLNSACVLIGLSGTMRDYWYVILLLIILGIFGARRYLKSPRGRARWDRFILRAPLFGPLVRMLAVSRLSKTLATLLASGVPLLTAFDIVKNVLQSRAISVWK